MLEIIFWNLAYFLRSYWINRNSQFLVIFKPYILDKLIDVKPLSSVRIMVRFLEQGDMVNLFPASTYPAGKYTNSGHVQEPFLGVCSYIKLDILI